MIIESWRRHYNESRPHTALGWLRHQEFALSAANRLPNEAGTHLPAGHFDPDHLVGPIT